LGSGITEAIFDAAQAIAKSTGVLVANATIVQQEFSKIMKSPQGKGTPYSNNKVWEDGLISAAKTVAGSVQYLVTAGNQAAQGQASEEALIVASKAVSAATTQLVMASIVKSDPNSQGQKKITRSSESCHKRYTVFGECCKNRTNLPN